MSDHMSKIEDEGYHGYPQGNPSRGQRRGERQTGHDEDPDVPGAKAERQRRRRTGKDEDPGEKHQGETT